DEKRVSGENGRNWHDEVPFPQEAERECAIPACCRNDADDQRTDLCLHRQAIKERTSSLTCEERQREKFDQQSIQRQCEDDGDLRVQFRIGEKLRQREPVAGEKAKS